MIKKILQYSKLKKKIKREISRSITSKQWEKARSLGSRMDRVKESMM